MLRVEIAESEATRETVGQLMGTKPEARFRFIQDNAEFASDELLDV
jgi:topoisomerase-4 subunit B